MTLTPEELRCAASIGVERYIDVVDNKRAPRFGASRPGAMWRNHIVGAIAELVVAKALGLYWEPTNRTFLGQADVGSNIEVRFNTVKVKDSDPDDTFVVFVKGDGNEYSVVGWTVAGFVKKEKWRKSPNNAPYYLVPEESLSEFRVLKQMVDAGVPMDLIGGQ